MYEKTADCRALFIDIDGQHVHRAREAARCEIDCEVLVSLPQQAPEGPWDFVAISHRVFGDGNLGPWALPLKMLVLVVDSDGPLEALHAEARTPDLVVTPNDLPVALRTMVCERCHDQEQTALNDRLSDMQVELERELHAAKERQNALSRDTSLVLSRILEVMEHRPALWAARRSALYSVTIGHVLGLSWEELEEVRLGALFCDVGLAALPDRLVDQVAQLTHDEQALYRVHPLYGAQLLDGSPHCQGIQDIISQHHERFDGDGAPLGLDGELISFGARIVAVGAALEEITTPPESLPLDDALLDLVHGAGSRFDPQVVAAARAVPETRWRALVSFGRAKERGFSVHPAMTHSISKWELVERVSGGKIEAFWSWICTPHHTFLGAP